MTHPVSHLPVHIAFSWLGVARRTPQGIAMGAEFGPYVETLASMVDRVTVLAYDPPPVAAGTEDLAEYVVRSDRDNVDVVSLGPKGTWRDYRQRRRRVSRIVSDASPAWDVLLLRFGRRSHLVFDASRCPRTVTLVHGPAAAGVGVETATLQERAVGAALSLRTRWHLRRILRRSRVLVTDGEECLELYGRYVDRASVIRLSVRRAEHAFRVHDRLTGPDPRFLFVGQLSRKKGIAETIRVFAAIRASLATAQLDVVGSGPDEAAARRLVHDAGIDGAVTFHGRIPPGDELFSRYRSADVLLFLSRSTTESFPRVVSEALAHSVLVIATPVGSLPRAFTDRHELLFVQPSADAVVDAVRTLTSDPELRQSMLERGRSWSAQTSLEHTSDALVSTIAKCWPELQGSST